jgi:hypothetical protein
MRVHVQRLDLEILAKELEKLPIGAGRITVGVRKMQQWFGHFFIDGTHGAMP